MALLAAVYRDLGNAGKISKLDSNGFYVCSPKIPPLLHGCEVVSEVQNAPLQVYTCS